MVTVEELEAWLATVKNKQAVVLIAKEYPAPNYDNTGVNISKMATQAEDGVYYILTE